MFFSDFIPCQGLLVFFNILLVYTDPGKKGLQVKKFVQSTTKSDGIAHLMPKEGREKLTSSD